MDISKLPEQNDGIAEEVVGKGEREIDIIEKPDDSNENDANGVKTEETANVCKSIENNDLEESRHESDNDDASDNEMEHNDSMSQDKGEEDDDAALHKPGVVKEIIICGNNMWNVFFKFVGDNEPESKEVGFFEFRRLLIEFKAGMISTKELKDPKDLSHFLTAQGEDCRVWAKVKPFVNKKSNFARYTTEDPYSGDDFFASHDGTKYDPKWFASTAWIGEEEQPKNTIRIFNTLEPGTKLVKIKMVHQQKRWHLFSFELDGKIESGYVRPITIFVKGTLYSKRQLSVLRMFGLAMDEVRKARKPIWGLVCPEIRDDLPASETNPMEVNGITYRPKWFARKIWVGDGASPPMDFIEGRSLIQLEKIKYGTEPIIDEKVNLAKILNEIVTCKVVTVHPDMLQAQIIPESEKYPGAKVVLPKLRTFINGKPPKSYFKFKETEFRTGDVFTCSITKRPEHHRSKHDIWKTSEFMAIAGWSGPTPPPMDILHQWINYRTESLRCRITSLTKDSEGRAIGGVAQITSRTSRGTVDRARIWFDREDTYFFGTCMGKADLSYFTDSDATVKLYYNPDKVLSDTSFLKQYNVKPSNFRWFKAETVSLGSLEMFPNHLFDLESKYEIDRDNQDLKDFLSKQRMDFETLEKHVQGLVEPRKNSRDKVRVEEQDQPEVEEVTVPEGSYLARVVGVSKPKRPDIPVKGGTFEIVDGPHANKLVAFSRINLYIYGRQMALVNLMDVLLYHDQFVVSLEEEDGKLKVLSAWKGARPCDTCEEDDKLYQSAAFKTWVNRHKIGNAKTFHAMVNGVLTKKPYFPLLPAPKGKSELYGKITFICNPLITDGIANSGRFKQFMLLELKNSTDSDLKDKIAVCEVDDMYFFGVNAGSCDLKLILKIGDAVKCEVKPIESDSELKALESKLPIKTDMAKLKFRCLLAYMGDRPKAPLKPHSNVTNSDLQSNSKLVDFLKRRRLPRGEFQRILKGAVDIVKTDVKANFRPDFRSERRSKEVVRDIPVDQSFNRQFIDLAEGLARRAIICVTPDDPNVARIVRSPEEMETALFLAKTLTSASFMFGESIKPSVQQHPVYVEPALPHNNFHAPSFGNRGGASGRGYGRQSGNEPQGYSTGMNNRSGYGNNTGYGNNSGYGNSPAARNYSEYNAPPPDLISYPDVSQYAGNSYGQQSGYGSRGGFGQSPQKRRQDYGMERGGNKKSRWGGPM